MQEPAFIRIMFSKYAVMIFIFMVVASGMVPVVKEFKHLVIPPSGLAISQCIKRFFDKNKLSCFESMQLGPFKDAKQQKFLDTSFARCMSNKDRKDRLECFECNFTGIFCVDIVRLKRDPVGIVHDPRPYQVLGPPVTSSKDTYREFK